MCETHERSKCMKRIKEWWKGLEDPKFGYAWIWMIPIYYIYIGLAYIWDIFDRKKK